MKKNELQAIMTLFNEQYKYYTDTLSHYNTIIKLADKKRVKKFVLDLFSKDEVYSKTQEQINEKLTRIVKINIQPDNLTFLCSLGFDFSGSVSNTAEKSLVDHFIENMTDSIVRYIAESKVEKDKIITLQNEYSKTLKEKDDVISILERELSSLGLFSLSKKKEIKQKIELARTDRDKFKNQSPIDNQFRSFQDKYI